jgi:hypothetical protein
MTALDTKNSKYFLIETSFFEMHKKTYKQLCEKYPQRQIGSDCIINGEFKIPEDEHEEALEWIMENSKTILHGVFPLNF